MLCCKEIFFQDLVFNVSRLTRLCSQTRFIAKQKEIDVKSFYLNLGSDKVAVLPVFHIFSGTDIKGSCLSQGKKIAGSKVISKASASLGTTITLTSETIVRLENFLGFFLPLPFKRK